MSAASRRQRGNDAARWYAAYCREHGWPHAEATGSGRGGVDVTGMPGLSVEVKATAEMRLGSWLDQAARSPGVPYVVWMPPRSGRARVSTWPAIMRHSVFGHLLADAGARVNYVHGTADTVNIPQWIAGTVKQSSPDVLLYRHRGADREDSGSWPVVLPVFLHSHILAAAGFGGPAVARERTGT